MSVYVHFRDISNGKHEAALLIIYKFAKINQKTVNTLEHFNTKSQ